MKTHRIILLGLIITGFQLITPGLNYAQSSDVARGLALERAKETKPLPGKIKKDSVKKQAAAGIEKPKIAKPKIKKPPVKVKPPVSERTAQASRKPAIIPEGPSPAQGPTDLDKDLKDWLDKLNTIEVTLP